MKVWIYREPYTMSLEDILCPEPVVADVLIRVRSVGLCGSDIHGFSGRTGRCQPGTVRGPEIAGEIVSVGYEY
jgi:L-iditol 2-dehydrogenase